MRIFGQALLAVLALCIMSCKRDSEEDPPPATQPGTIKISFSFLNGSSPFDLSALTHDGAGHVVKFSTLKFYASDFHLLDDADQTVAEFHGNVVLVDASAASNLFTLGTLSPNHVHEAHMSLGLDDELNGSDPATAAYPLDQMGMYLGSGSGYVFLLMEGRVDGNADGDLDDAEDPVFIYKCGTAGLLRDAHVHLHANVASGSTVSMQAGVDVEKLLSGLDLLATPSATGGETGNITAMDSLAVAIDEL